MTEQEDTTEDQEQAEHEAVSKARNVVELASEALSALRDYEGSNNSNSYTKENKTNAVSITTRKKLAQRSGHRLFNARTRLEQLASGADGLLQHVMECVHESEHISSRLHEYAHQTATLNEQLEASTTRERDAISLNEKLNEQLHKVQNENAELSQRLHSLQAENEKLQTADARAQEAESAREEAERARNLAVAQENELRQQDSSLQEEVNRWRTTADRHRNAVARLAADNVEMMVRLRGAESELEKAREEVKQLEEEARQQRSQWIEEAKSTVHDAVSSGLKRRDEADAEVRAEREKREAAESELHSERSHVSALQKSLDETNEKCSSLQSQLDASHITQQQAAQQYNELMERVQQLEHEVNAEREKAERADQVRSEAQKATDDEKARRTRAEKQVQEHEGAKRYAERLLQQQKNVNAQLMQQKEAVEWQLMDLKATAANASDHPNGKEMDADEIDGETTSWKRHEQRSMHGGGRGEEEEAEECDSEHTDGKVVVKHRNEGEQLKDEAMTSTAVPASVVSIQPEPLDADAISSSFQPVYPQEFEERSPQAQSSSTAALEEDPLVAGVEQMSLDQSKKRSNDLSFGNALPPFIQ